MSSAESAAGQQAARRPVGTTVKTRELSESELSARIREDSAYLRALSHFLSGCLDYPSCLETFIKRHQLSEADASVLRRAVDSERKGRGLSWLNQRNK